MKKILLFLLCVATAVVGMEHELEFITTQQTKQQKKKQANSYLYNVLTSEVILNRANVKSLIAVPKKDMNEVISLALANGVNSGVEDGIKYDSILNLCSYTTKHKVIVKSIKQLQKKVTASSGLCKVSPREVAYLAMCLHYRIVVDNWYQNWSAKSGLLLNTKVDDSITLVSGKKRYELKGDLAKCLHGFKALQILEKTGRSVTRDGYCRYQFGLKITEEQICYHSDVALIPTFNKDLKTALEATHDPLVTQYALK